MSGTKGKKVYVVTYHDLHDRANHLLCVAGSLEAAVDKAEDWIRKSPGRVCNIVKSLSVAPFTNELVRVIKVDT